MRFWFLLISIIPLVSVAGAARASTQTDMEDCQQAQEVDRSIAGCSKLTVDQSLAAPVRAIAYFDRGLAYYAKRDFDRAIADWSEAIALNPGYAHAYNNRAKAFRAKGDFLRSVADYDEAIKLQPQHSVAYKGRGIAYFLSGNAAKALADFRQAEKIAPDAYTLLWLDLAARRANQPFEIGPASQQVVMSSWPGPLVLMFGGQMSARDVAVAAQDQNEKVRQARLCDAYFYTGESMLLKNDKDQATALLQRAVGTCSPTVDEYSSAASELKTLGKPAEAPSQDVGRKAEGTKPSQ